VPFRDWSPEERAGQHIMAGFEGAAPPPALVERVRAGRVGGVILFGRNIESAAQALDLTFALQRAAARSRRGVPLLVAIDQEGGRVSRLSPDFTRFPAARAFGRIGDRGLAREAARATGAELRAAGVNLNFAPVLDLLTNPACAVIGDRAYGADPALVGEMAAAVIRGLQAEGVAACAKHFPGIGDMAPDPHETLPVSGLSLEDLRRRELLPYREAFNPRLPSGGAAAVMAAHAVYTPIDPERPASGSPRIIGGLLREEMRFRGLAVTDDLEMGAIADPAEAALDSIRAGADIALICHSEAAQEGALGRIARALREGEIPPEAEALSLRRLLGAKAHFAPPIERTQEEGQLARLHAEREAIVGRPAHRAAAEEAARREAAELSNN